jgi:8-oxo-dGTP pyrophosphatase MutT (NUDIX family)
MAGAGSPAEQCRQSPSGGPDVSTLADGWASLMRLRERLAGTDDQPPRRLASLGFPEPVAALLRQQIERGFRASAVLVPIVQRGETLTVLLTRRAETLRSHQGQVSFPGGRQDPEDRHLRVTALREAEEEIGLPATAVEVIGYLDDYPTLTGYRVTPVVGLVRRPPPAWRPAVAEVADIFEMPLQRALDPATFRQKTLLRDGLRLPFYEFDHDGHRVWGATAGILKALSEAVHHP